MTIKFTYTRLLVTNFRACFLFYGDVLGFEATFGDENGTYADFDCGGTVHIALFDKLEMSKALGTDNKPARADSQDAISLIFGVENVDDTCAQLQAKGARIDVAPTDHPDWGIRTAYLRDPEGNLIELNHDLPHD